MAVKCQGLASGSLPESVTDRAPVRSPFFKGSSTPHAHAEARGEEDAEGNDSDQPHVFLFHRSSSPYLKGTFVPLGLGIFDHVHGLLLGKRDLHFVRGR
jgi:hypothetical protein